VKWVKDWIDLVEDKDTCWAVVNVVVSYRVPQNAGNYLTTCGPVSF